MLPFANSYGPKAAAVYRMKLTYNRQRLLHFLEVRRKVVPWWATLQFTQALAAWPAGSGTLRASSRRPPRPLRPSLGQPIQLAQPALWPHRSMPTWPRSRTHGKLPWLGKNAQMLRFTPPATHQGTPA